MEITLVGTEWLVGHVGSREAGREQGTPGAVVDGVVDAFVAAHVLAASRRRGGAGIKAPIRAIERWVGVGGVAHGVTPTVVALVGGAAVEAVRLGGARVAVTVELRAINWTGGHVARVAGSVKVVSAGFAGIWSKSATGHAAVVFGVGAEPTLFSEEAAATGILRGTLVDRTLRWIIVNNTASCPVQRWRFGQQTGGVAGVRFAAR